MYRTNLDNLEESKTQHINLKQLEDVRTSQRTCTTFNYRQQPTPTHDHPQKLKDNVKQTSQTRKPETTINKQKQPLDPNAIHKKLKLQKTERKQSKTTLQLLKKTQNTLQKNRKQRKHTHPETNEINEKQNHKFKTPNTSQGSESTQDKPSQRQTF